MVYGRLYYFEWVFWGQYYYKAILTSSRFTNSYLRLFNYNVGYNNVGYNVGYIVGVYNNGVYNSVGYKIGVYNSVGYNNGVNQQCNQHCNQHYCNPTLL